jgi:hypothetical protein
VSARGTIDASILFQELGIRLLRSNGRTSLIVQNKFLSAPFGDAFRNFAIRSCELRVLADFSKIDVFHGVGAYPVIYVLECADNPRQQYEIILEDYERHEMGYTIKTSKNVLSDMQQIDTWSELFSSGTSLLNRLKQSFPAAGAIYEIAASASAGEAYELKKCITEGKPEGHAFKLVTSGAIDRYRHTHGTKTIRYLKTAYQSPYLPSDCGALSHNRKRQYSSEKIIFAGMTKRLEAIWDDGVVAGSVPTVQILSKDPSDIPHLKYELGICNSTLINWVFNQSFSSLSLAGGYLRIGVPQIKVLPIRTIDFANLADVALHDQMVSLVQRMLALNEQAHAARTSHDRTILQRQIDGTDRQIDRLVYQLYELTDDEIAIVEAGTA